jgi:hypothetical protein
VRLYRSFVPQAGQRVGIDRWQWRFMQVTSVFIGVIFAQKILRQRRSIGKFDERAR